MRYKIFYAEPKNIREIPHEIIREAPAKRYHMDEKVPDTIEVDRTFHRLVFIQREKYDPDINCHYGFLKLSGIRVQRALWSQWEMLK